MTDTMQLLQDYATSGDNLWLLHKLQELQVEIEDEIEDYFLCNGEDCGIPLDLIITYNTDGLPEIN